MRFAAVKLPWDHNLVIVAELEVAGTVFFLPPFSSAKLWIRFPFIQSRPAGAEERFGKNARRFY